MLQFLIFITLSAAVLLIFRPRKKKQAPAPPVVKPTPKCTTPAVRHVTKIKISDDMATLSVSFNPAVPAPAVGYIMKYRQAGTQDPYQTVTGTTSPLSATVLANQSYEGTIESDCGGGSFGTPVAFSDPGLVQGCVNVTSQNITDLVVSCGGDNYPATGVRYTLSLVDGGGNPLVAVDDVTIRLNYTYNNCSGTGSSYKEFTLPAGSSSVQAPLVMVSSMDDCGSGCEAISEAFDSWTFVDHAVSVCGEIPT